MPRLIPVPVNQRVEDYPMHEIGVQRIGIFETGQLPTIEIHPPPEVDEHGFIDGIYVGGDDSPTSVTDADQWVTDMEQLVMETVDLRMNFNRP